MKSLLASLVFLALAGCGRQSQRFVDAGGPTLDTKTGQYCNSALKQSNELPLCYDLYKNE